MHASIFEYPWRVVNMYYVCIARVHSSCPQAKIASFVRVPCDNMNMIVNLAVSCTVATYVQYSSI